jgi:hypothetical protein
VKENTKVCILCDSIHMKYPEDRNPHRQKADWWLPGTWGRGKLVMITEVSFHVLEVSTTENAQYYKSSDIHWLYTLRRWSDEFYVTWILPQCKRCKDKFE